MIQGGKGSRRQFAYLYSSGGTAFIGVALGFPFCAGVGNAVVDCWDTSHVNISHDVCESGMQGWVRTRPGLCCRCLDALAQQNDAGSGRRMRGKMKVEIVLVTQEARSCAGLVDVSYPMSVSSLVVISSLVSPGGPGCSAVVA